ncbi:macrophage mannose receptor 1-like [Centroberyx affinis]|uniref:macrophage mannose receptor 1-like n=1 Tax=Centroberyx affinis TaxID=166261 RepID=UPI003A5C1FBA
MERIQTPTALSREYHYVNLKKNWTEAQSYCREKFDDLATIDNEDDVDRAIHVTKSVNLQNRFWIGLHDRWKWSSSDHYGDEETSFRNWKTSEPSPGSGQNCIIAYGNRQWADELCSVKKWFLCYHNDAHEKYIKVEIPMTWSDGQKHCRRWHTDLVTIRNQEENDQICGLLDYDGTHAWIGLHRTPWTWSDKRTNAFSKWDLNQPNHSRLNQRCVAMNSDGKWVDTGCAARYPFVCYKVPRKTVEVFKVQVILGGSVDLNDPMLQEAMLQQVKMKMNSHGMQEYFTLRWKIQPDGKMFHKRKEEKKSTGDCEDESN